MIRDTTSQARPRPRSQGIGAYIQWQDTQVAAELPSVKIASLLTPLDPAVEKP